MEEVGIVTHTEGIEAYVSVTRKSACEHCTAGTCDLSGENSSIKAFNEAGAITGQRVRVHMQSLTYVKGSFFFYGLPALSLLLGAVIGRQYISGLLHSTNPEAVSAITAFTCMALSFVIVKLLSSKAEKSVRYQPVIKEILDD